MTDQFVVHPNTSGMSFHMLAYCNSPTLVIMVNPMGAGECHLVPKRELELDDLVVQRLRLVMKTLAQWNRKLP